MESNLISANSAVHILDLCANCETVDSLVVIRDRKWRRPADILEKLKEFGDFNWTLNRTIKTCKDQAKEKPPGFSFVNKTSELNDVERVCCILPHPQLYQP